MERYQSDYSNEVHQLIVTPSKHYFVTKNGQFKFQKKAFEVTLNDCGTQTRKHVIHYLIRDHFSGVFHWEICLAENPIPIYEFLFRAWRKKEEANFCGMPDFITIPKNVQSFFPGLLNFIQKAGIAYLKVTSGFQGGVRDIRTIENTLKIVGFYFNLPQADPPFDLVLEKTSIICNRLIGGIYRKPSKIDRWISGIVPDQEIVVPKSLQQFETIYQTAFGK